MPRQEHAMWATGSKREATSTSALFAATRGLGLDEEPRVMERLEAMVRLDPRVAEPLQTLSEERSLRAALGQLGVSERSLQRLLQSETGRPPVYWKRLPGPAAPNRMCARRQRPAGTSRPPSWLRRSGPYEPGVSPLTETNADPGSKATRSVQTAGSAGASHTTRTLLMSNTPAFAAAG